MVKYQQKMKNEKFRKLDYSCPKLYKKKGKTRKKKEIKGRNKKLEAIKKNWEKKLEKIGKNIIKIRG